MKCVTRDVMYHVFSSGVYQGVFPIWIFIATNNICPFIGPLERCAPQCNAVARHIAVEFKTLLKYSVVKLHSNLIQHPGEIPPYMSPSLTKLPQQH